MAEEYNNDATNRITELNKQLERAVLLLKQHKICDTPIYGSLPVFKCKGCPDCGPVNGGADLYD